MATYKTAPAPITTMPKGVPYIISNELAERFSFYGMRTILVIFMTKYLIGENGQLDVMSHEEAQGYIHLFISAAYFFPLLGAFLSDVFLGKYTTIISLSLVYCLGHAALALDETRTGLFVGLVLIAIGAGGIKPCVSAHVGDQFGRNNEHLLSKVFGGFYFSINLGAFVSSLLTPYLLSRFGPQVAFGVPGVLMFLATVCFWMGRNKFVHIPPGGMKFVREALSPEGLRAVGKLSIVFVFVIMFWSLFDQTGSAWVLQAQDMDRNWMGIEWLPSQIQAFNPLLIMLFIPLFNYVIYPAVDKVFPLTAMRKISIGLFLAALSFSIPIWIETELQAGNSPSISWQLLSYVILTASEVLVSITCLEFSYTQAPKKMKAVVSAMLLLTISLGNLFTAGVNFFIQNDDGTSKLEGASYYTFFTVMMLVAAVLFVFVALFYKEQRYIQDTEETSAETPNA